ncbi:hypothetical protein RchiOBHm_Chr6g0249231 [Rosa chinensis]|uniref:Uncharacterized protein n=1 Tax=Rosa chinensis TaxID=74649 RepID=A0A2P6PK87_ROSCH|nr:hypothetical protein RchiOBHm_Chr6g0249231 [Rosa chinensis]
MWDCFWFCKLKSCWCCWVSRAALKSSAIVTLSLGQGEAKRVEPWKPKGELEAKVRTSGIIVIKWKF